MGEYRLSESLWRRGWRDTWAGWKNPLFGILDAVVCVVVGSVFGWYWGLGLFTFAMFCVWVGATAKAPIAQRNEAREAFTILLFATQPSEIVHHLSLFYAEATKLMIKKINTDDELKIWDEEVNVWQKRSIEWVKENISVADSVLLSRTIANPAMSFNDAYNNLHNKRLEFLYYRSKQLEQLINRYQLASQIKEQ